jgi:hypothetical protein
MLCQDSGFFVFVLLRQGHYVAQAGLELKILVPQPPECWLLGLCILKWQSR